MGSEASSKIEVRTASSHRSNATESPLREQTLKSPRAKRKQGRNRDTAREDTDLRNGNLLPWETVESALPDKAGPYANVRKHAKIYAKMSIRTCAEMCTRARMREQTYN